MNRFLTRGTAMVLGLALYGTATADGRAGRPFSDERFVRERTADCTRGTLRYFDPSRPQSYWDLLRYLDHWWFNRDLDDLRYFDHFNWGNYYCFDHGHR